MRAPGFRPQQPARHACHPLQRSVVRRMRRQGAMLATSSIPAFFGKGKGLVTPICMTTEPPIGVASSIISLQDCLFRGAKELPSWAPVCPEPAIPRARPISLHRELSQTQIGVHPAPGPGRADSGLGRREGETDGSSALSAKRSPSDLPAKWRRARSAAETYGASLKPASRCADISGARAGATIHGRYMSDSSQ